ncbi:MAG: GAF and ANTAR domain-containing protein [Acidimicrobiia bacterium]
MSSDAGSDALVALSRFLVSELSLGDTLRRVATIAVKAVPGAEVAGLTTPGPDGRPATTVYTDDTSPNIDAAQYESGRGPCLDAWRESRVVYVPDLAAAPAYPEFAELALRHGVHSTLSFPLAAGERSAIGALNLYSRRPRGFTDEDHQRGVQLAAAAAIVLANASAYWQAFEMSEQLNEAMASRAVIEQAKGVLMATMGCDAERAFELLREQSQAENRKLRDIAHEIADRQPRRAT